MGRQKSKVFIVVFRLRCNSGEVFFERFLHGSCLAYIDGNSKAIPLPVQQLRNGSVAVAEKNIYLCRLIQVLPTGGRAGGALYLVSKEPKDRRNII